MQGYPPQQPDQAGFVPPLQPLPPGVPGPLTPGYGAPEMATGSALLSETDRKREVGRAVRIAGVMIFLFGIVCMLTAGVFGMKDGSVVTGTVAPSGGDIGPITVDKDGTVLEFKVHEPLSGYGWSYVDGEMLDSEKEYLFGFGYELWHETGYDEGRWDEQENKFDFKLTVPKKGTYYAHLSTEQQPGKPIGGNITVLVKPVIGSSVPYFAAGIVGLVGGVFFFVIGAMMTPARISDDDDDDDD